jgi:hypothetical protein
VLAAYRDKGSSLFDLFIIGEENKVDVDSMAQCYLSFFVRNLQIFVKKTTVFVRLGLKSLPGTNTLAYYENS